MKSLFEDAIQIASDFSELSKQLDRLTLEVSKAQSNCDKELTDIYHYIEFSNLSASDGYKAYKMLHDILKNRREVKNALQLVQSLQTRGLNKDVESKNLAEISLLKNDRTYTPRIRDDLFDINNKKDGYTIKNVSTNETINFTDLDSLVDWFKSKIPATSPKPSKKKMRNTILSRIKQNKIYNGYLIVNHS